MRRKSSSFDFKAISAISKSKIAGAAFQFQARTIKPPKLPAQKNFEPMETFEQKILISERETTWFSPVLLSSITFFLNFILSTC
jgi:hypothetical protein